MAGFNIAILLLVGLAVTSAQNCGSVAEGTIMPNANNCNSYYVCTAGILTSYQCPGNYGYSTVSQTCSPTANCAGQINNNPYYGNNNNGYNYPYYGNNYPNYGNNYPNYGNNGPYWNGVAWIYPNNANNVNWIYPSNVENEYPNYGNGYGYPYYYSATEESNPCLGVADGSYVPSQSSCSQFYFCSQGQAVTSNCPSGYGFSTSKQSCVASTTCIA